MTGAERKCRAVLARYRETIEQVARKAVLTGQPTEDFVIVCIERGGARWGAIIAQALGAKSGDVDKFDAFIGKTSVDNILPLLRRKMPQLARRVAQRVRDGRLRVLVINGDVSALLMEKFQAPEEPN